MYNDEYLRCVDCGRDFVFTAGEQEFFASKGFQNKPSRCPECRAARKGSHSSAQRNPRREMFTATCSQCGGVAEVPFQPRSDKPVYCRDCFAARPSYR
jgi:CxxC-x17-CxxC domain-containing protein